MLATPYERVQIMLGTAEGWNDPDSRETGYSNVLENTWQHTSKLQEAAKKLEAYKEKEDLAETVTLLNRGSVLLITS